MAKTNHEKFLSFKKRNSLDNRQIMQIAKEYAESPLDFARTYFSEEYGISPYTFYKCIEFSIVFWLVNFKTAEAIRKKSAKNYAANNKYNATIDSSKKFKRLYCQRKEFIETFDENKIKDIGQKYINGCPISEIASIFDIGEFGIGFLLKMGIEKLFFNRDLVEKITAKIPNGEIKLNKILKNREGNKQLLLSAIEKEIEAYKYYSKVNNISEETLKERLNDAIKRYNEASQL